MDNLLAFAAGFALAWWYRPRWILRRLREYVETHRDAP